MPVRAAAAAVVPGRVRAHGLPALQRPTQMRGVWAGGGAGSGRLFRVCAGGPPAGALLQARLPVAGHCLTRAFSTSTRCTGTPVSQSTSQGSAAACCWPSARPLSPSPPRHRPRPPSTTSPATNGTPLPSKPFALSGCPPIGLTTNPTQLKQPDPIFIINSIY